MTTRRTVCFFPAILLFLASCLSIFSEEPKKIDPIKWEKEITAIEAKSKDAGPPKDAILFVGSSSIRLWDLATSWPGLAVLNHGFGGSTLPDTLYYFDRLVVPFAPKAVVVYAGDNDIGSFGRTAAEVVADFETLAGKMEKQLPGIPLIYIAIKPSVKRWKLWPENEKANEAIANFCEANPKLFYADIAAPMLAGRDGAPAAEWFREDGLHLTPMGYAEWTRVIRAKLTEAGVLAE